MDDMRRYMETQGHSIVALPEDKSLALFCAQVRHARKNPGKTGMQLTEERITALNAIGFEILR